MAEKEIAYEILQEFKAQFENNPFDFLYEADIQGILFCKLWEKFQSNLIRINGGYHKNEGHYGDGRNYIETNPVKTEYPSGIKFDIAVINKDCRIEYDKVIKKDPYILNDTFWNQPLKLAVEIKYSQLCEGINESGFKSDLEKLYNYYDFIRKNRPGEEFYGIALLFIQPYNYLENIKEAMKGEIIEGMAEIKQGIQGYIIAPEKSFTLKLEGKVCEL